MEDEWLGSEGHGGGRIQVVAHKLTWLGGSQAAGLEVGDEQLYSNGHS